MRNPTGGNLSKLFAVATLSLVSAGLPTKADAPSNNMSFVNRLRNGPGDLNHPVHVKPSASVTLPAGWPTDVDGTITCLTCHAKLPSLEGGGDPNLRSVDGRSDDPSSSFCTNCHASRDGPSAKSMHWQATRFAHVRFNDHRVSRSLGRLDAESRKCLGCHDGVNAVESNNAFSAGGFSWDARREHPIGMSYRRKVTQTSDVPLRPASLLPPAIRLPDGRVSCVSCHDLYGGKKDLLSVPIEGSALCMTCHDLN